MRMEKMTNRELTKYMLECIFIVWFKIFTSATQYYPRIYSIDFIKYAENFLSLIKKKVVRVLIVV